jgi:zinc D-Ala-D-Ala carboxypeptidase
MTFISEHITYAEATHTATGYKNEPNTQQLEAMQLTAEKVFEPLRHYISEPIKVDSFFRSKAVNEALPNSSNTSQHCRGEAIDIKAVKFAGYTNADLFHYIQEHLVFDQLIWEYGTEKEPSWVHVSYSAIRNRKQALRAQKLGSKTIYSNMR